MSTHYNVRLVVEEVFKPVADRNSNSLPRSNQPKLEDLTKVKTLAEFKTTGDNLNDSIKRAISVLQLVEEDQ